MMERCSSNILASPLSHYNYSYTLNLNQFTDPAPAGILNRVFKKKTLFKCKVIKTRDYIKFK